MIMDIKKQKIVCAIFLITFLQSIAITDSEASPLAQISQYTLKARSDMASFVDSLVAPLSLVNALLVEVSRKKNEDLSKTFQTLEKIWEEYGVYEKVQE